MIKKVRHRYIDIDNKNSFLVKHNKGVYVLIVPDDVLTSFLHRSDYHDNNEGYQVLSAICFSWEHIIRLREKGKKYFCPDIILIKKTVYQIATKKEFEAVLSHEFMHIALSKGAAYYNKPKGYSRTEDLRKNLMEEFFIQKKLTTKSHLAGLKRIVNKFELVGYDNKEKA